MSAAPGEGVGSAVGHDEPVTTNAFAPPPKTLAVVDAGPEGPATGGVDMTHETPPVVVATPHAACTDQCRTDWSACKSDCKTKTCAACETSYGGCMKKCF
jgi:hypothetical protein